MLMLILGGLLIGTAAVLDSFFRGRMRAIGSKWALLQGGAFDYSNYHEARKEHGWPAWPVYLMWTAIIFGLALLIAGFFAYFGTAPRHP
jgi:hypothetical protein